MSKSYFVQCPRCGTRSYEQLHTHGHCVECLYSTDLNAPSEPRDFLTLREAEATIETAETKKKRRDQKEISGAAS